MATFIIDNSAGTPHETVNRLVDNSAGAPFSVSGSIKNSSGAPFVLSFVDSVGDTISLTSSEELLQTLYEAIASTLTFNDETSDGTWWRTLSDTVSLIGSIEARLDISLQRSDNLTLTSGEVDSVEAYNKLIEDFVLSEVSKAGFIYEDTTSDTFSLTSEELGDWHQVSKVIDAFILVDILTEGSLRLATLSETISLTDAFAVGATGRSVVDTLYYQASIASNTVQAATMVDTLVMRATIKLAYELFISEDFTLTASALMDKQFLGRVKDICNFVDSPLGFAKISAVMSVVFELMDEQSLSFAGALKETLSLISSNEVEIAYRASAIETLLLTSDTSCSVGVLGTASDTLLLDDIVDSTGLFQALCSDELNFQISFVDGREEYSGWVINSHNFGVTEYLNYAFNSFTKVGGSYLAAGPGGLFKLHTGDTDNGADVDALLRTGKLNVGNGHQSRVEHAYLGVQSEGRLLMKTITGKEKVRWYQSDAPKVGLDNLRTKLGRGVKSAYWQFEIANIDGQDLEIENMQFFPVVLTRRV